MPLVSVPAFVESLRRLQLLSPAQLSELIQTLRREPLERRALAKELLRRGWLTSYQISEVFQGRGEALVLGQYVLLQPLGQGGMGQVFKARHRRLNRIVAVKILRPERLSKPDAARRFYREIQAAAQLAHPNIVLAYDADQVGDRIFFSMEYVEGVDLQQMVQQSGPLPVALACDYIRQAALGLQHAFERGLVHRDIKPPNLLVTNPPSGKRVAEGSDPSLVRGVTISAPPTPPSGTPRGPLVKIFDMGLARLKWTSNGDEEVSTLTQEGLVFGTLDFIAPEQAADSHQVDIRADLYSLGCTFYYLLAGQVPFPGGTPLEKLFKHQNVRPQPLERFRQDVPAEVAAVVDKLMAKRPEERYQTPAELAAALAFVLEQVRVPAGGGPAPAKELEEFSGAAPLRADGGAMSTPSPGTASQDTSDSLSNWASIVNTPVKLDPGPVPAIDEKSLKKQWLRLAGAGGGLCLLGVVVLVVLLNRPEKQATKAEGKTGPAAKGKAPQEKQPGEVVSRPTSIIVPIEANKPWQDTGVEVMRERPITISATGEWRKGQAAFSAAGLWGESRERNVLPAAPPLCLLGRVGDEATSFFLGTARQLVPKWTGRLFVQANTLDLHELSGSLTLEMLGGLRKTDTVGPPGPTRVEAAEAALKSLLARAAGPKPDPEGLGPSLLALCLQYPGTPQAALAAEMLRQFPSAFDRLNPAWIPASERFVWQPKELVAVLGDHRRRHWGPVLSVAFSPDGKLVASGGEDALIRLWNTTTGREEAALKGHSGPVHTLVFVSDGKTLISVSGGANQPSEIKLWDVNKAEESAVIRGFSNVLLSSDGKTLATKNDDGSIKIWDRVTGKERATLTGHTGAVSSVAISSDGKTAASGSADMSVKLWDISTGVARHTLKGHATGVTAVALAPDGKTVASASTDGTIKLWDVATGQDEATLKGHGAGIGSLAFAPDGKSLASAGADRTVRLWDKATGQMRTVFQGHSADVVCLAFSADGKTLASGGADRTVRLWDAASDAEPVTFTGHSDRVWSVAVSPDGKLAASASADATVRVWDLDAGTERSVFKKHTNAATAVAFSCDGKMVASADGDGIIRLWAPITGTERNVVLTGHEGPVFSLAFAPGDHTLASGGRDATVRLWDPATGKERQLLKGHTAAVRAVAVSPDGKLLATASDDTQVKLWDVATGKERDEALKGHTGPVKSVAFSSDGTALASAGEDGTIRLWDVTTSKERALLKGHTDCVNALAYASGGTTLASGSRDGIVKFWHLPTGQERTTLRGHTGAVWSLAFSPDGQKLVTASEDKTVRRWRARRGQELYPLQESFGPALSVACAPDSGTLAASFADGSVKLWDVSTPSERGASVRTFQAHPEDVLSLAFAPDGKTLASAARDRTVKLWDFPIAGGRSAPAPRLTLQGHGDAVWTAAFSPDGLAIASGSADKTVRIWDPAKETPLHTLQEQALIAVYGVASDGKIVPMPSADQSVRLWQALADQRGFSFEGDPGSSLSWVIATDGRHVATRGENTTVRLWDAVTQKERLTLQGHTAPVTAGEFSPDGKTFASGSEDQSAKLWDVDSGKELHTLPGNTGPVWFVAFTPDSRKVVTLGDSGRGLFVWDVASGKRLLEWRLPGVVHGIAFAPDGRHLATANGNGTVYVLRMAPSPK